MENEAEITALDQEFITFEVEYNSSAADEVLKHAAQEDESRWTTNGGELKCTTVKEVKKISCQICDKSFSKVYAYNYHMRKIHDVNVKPANASRCMSNIVCPMSECREKFLTLATLRDHIVKIHKIDLELEVKTFRSYEEFCQWKEDMERETKSHYAKKSTCNKKSMRDHFICHRSGFYTPHGMGIRPLRRKGSKRIGAFCPAAIYVTHSRINSYVKVEFWKKHLGHNSDMNFLPLTQREKMEIADKIKKGMTYKEILQSYRNSVSGPELYRINFLSLTDIYRIAEKLKLTRRKRRRIRAPKREDELIDLWVKDMQTHGNDCPVAFFKRQGMESEQLNLEDFMIVIMTKYQKEIAIKYSGKNICIDSVHGTSPDSFSLTTLVTIESPTAFPLAFCISSRTDEVSMRIFFDSVKRLAGAIETPVFMSSEPSFYDVWEKVMAPSSFQLLSKWYVDSCWRRDLDKIADKDKQESVYKTLRVLLEESEVFEFESSINKFVVELEEDTSTREFGEYFCSNYLPRVKMWAFCYMRHLGISNIEPLEALHTTLENIFSIGGEGDSVYNRQINLAIPALLKLIRDAMLDRLDEFLGCFPDRWSVRIHYGHRQGLKRRKITALDKNSWSVKLFRRIDGHVVTENEASCSLEVCYLRCSRCDICIHSYFCTCFDNLINLNICGHIHASARFSTGSESVDEVNNLSTSSKSKKNAGKEKLKGAIPVRKERVDVAVGTDEVSEASIDSVIPSPSRTLLTKQLHTIKTMMEYAEFSVEHTSQIKNSLDAIISFMVMHGKSKTPFIRVPYQPAKNYVSTVRRLPDMQHRKQLITRPHPVSLLKNAPVSLLQNNAPVSLLQNNAPVSLLKNNAPVSLLKNNAPVSLLKNNAPVSLLQNNASVSLLKNNNLQQT